MAVPPALTTDGYEIQFGTNHMGHALLIKLLLPLLQQTAAKPGADVRIVLLSSLAYQGVNSLPFAKLKTPQSIPYLGGFACWVRYFQSKLANVLYAKQLAKRYPEITTVAIHPGVIHTELVTNLGLFQRLFIYAANLGQSLTHEQGVYNALWASTWDKKDIQNGEIYLPVGKVGEKTKGTTNEELEKKLWDWTQKELEAY